MRRQQPILLLFALLLGCWPGRAAATEDHDKVFDMVREGQLQLLQLMIFEPDELNDMRDTWGATLLHEAVRRGHIDVTIWLLQNNCDVDVLDRNGYKPLYHAPATNSLEIVKVLVQNGADYTTLDSSNANLLHVAAGQGTAEMVRYAMNLKLDLNHQDDEKRTPLIWAADALNVDTTRELLAQAPLLDVQDDRGRTALHHTADPYNGWDDEDKYQVAAMLLDAGADPEITDDYGRLASDRADTWALYFLLAPPTSAFQIHLLASMICATILTLIPLLIWRSVSRKPA